MPVSCLFERLSEDRGDAAIVGAGDVVEHRGRPTLEFFIGKPRRVPSSDNQLRQFRRQVARRCETRVARINRKMLDQLLLAPLSPSE